ncbi:MAG: NADH-quinone oxidoreductase subunit NuoH [Fibrobacteria bacterium]|nr:NADH-quinone oxidoreductase subunit NuoH [Fibrobacteria bacterium]
MNALADFIINSLGLSGLSAELVMLLLVVAVAAAVFGIGMTISGLLTLAERRVAGRIQSRIGPNRVGPFGLLQWLVDGLKLIMKEDVVPHDADPHMFRMAPYLVVVGVFAAFASLPFGQLLIASDLNVGILYLLAITSLVTVGVLMSGWASNNKWSMIGGIRAAAQIVSYEIPTALSVASIILISGTLSMQGIINEQGGWPWQWYIFYNPFTFAVFFLYFTAALAEGNRIPFDLPEAESELVSGYNTEYSGMRFAGFFLAEFANIYLMSAIATTLFFGGWQIPGVTPEQQAGSLVLQITGMVVFMSKSAVGCFVVIWIRWTLPRLRIDQLMSLCYKYLIPLSFVCLGGNAIYLLIFPKPSSANTLVHMITTLFGGVLIVIFVTRVMYHHRISGVSLDLNFLARGEKGKYNPETQVRAYGSFRKKYEKKQGAK